MSPEPLSLEGRAFAACVVAKRSPFSLDPRLILVRVLVGLCARETFCDVYITCHKSIV